MFWGRWMRGVQLRQPGWWMEICYWLWTGNRWSPWSMRTLSRRSDRAATESAWAPYACQEDTFTERWVFLHRQYCQQKVWSCARLLFVIPQLGISPLLFRERLVVGNKGKTHASQENTRGAHLRSAGLMYPTVCVEEAEFDQQVQPSDMAVPLLLLQ